MINFVFLFHDVGTGHESIRGLGVLFRLTVQGVSLEKEQFC